MGVLDRIGWRSTSQRRYGDWRDFALPNDQIDEAVPNLPEPEDPSESIGRRLANRAMGHGKMVGTGLLEGGLGPVVGIAETVGLAPEGTRQDLRGYFEDTRDEYLSEDPSMLRSAIGFGSEVAGGIVPLTPGGAIASKVGQRIGGRIAGKVAGGAAAGGIEGAVAGFGDSAGLDVDERIKATLAGGGLGTLMGTLGGMRGARIGEKILDTPKVDVPDATPPRVAEEMLPKPLGRPGRKPSIDMPEQLKAPDDFETPFQVTPDDLDLTDALKKELLSDDLFSNLEGIQDQRRHVQHWDKFDNMKEGIQKKYNLHEEDFRRLRPGQALNDDQLALLSGHLGSRVTERAQLREMVAASPGDTALQKRLEAASRASTDLLKTWVGARAEAGRSLASLKTVKHVLDGEDEIRRMVLRENPDLSQSDLAELSSMDVDNPKPLGE